ncbi:MAG: alcohol dehydrogenase catalytic domain-containing protein [bacterium]|nr:alcohol dehydrogenase catalytic domain-containing protein [bacterium]
MFKFLSAYCIKPKKELIIKETTIENLKPKEVLVKVLYSGICHSDIHIIDGDWESRGFIKYPLVPGHEIVGEVVETGNNVNFIKKGDIVGLPWVYSSCLNCDYCISANEQFCENRKITGIDSIGGFSQYIIALEDFLTIIPKDMDLAQAAPLFCAGLTVYSAIKNLNLKANSFIAILGIGGLGHLAIQIAKSFGLNVISFSSNENKKDLAIKLGSDYFLNYNEIDKLKNIGKIDAVLSTLPNIKGKSEIVMNFINYLKPFGKISFVGAHLEELTFKPIDLISKNLIITGSAVGSRINLRELINLAYKKNIKTVIQEFSFKDINLAIEKVRKGQIIFRAVINFFK